MAEGSSEATSCHDCVPVEPNTIAPVVHSGIPLHMEQVPSESGLADVDCSLVGLDSSMEDIREEQTMEEFISNGCGCQLGPKETSCVKYLTRQIVERCRQDCLELSRDELDLIVLSQIHSLRSTPDQPTLRLSHHVTGSKSRSTFYVHGVPICLKTFLYLHCMSRTRYENLVHHYYQNGLCPRVHGNARRLPPNTLPQEEVVHLVTFIKNYDRAHGLPLPGRVPGHRDKV